MNHPKDDGHDSRLERLEQELHLLIRQAKAHELDLNQVKALLERIKLDTGSSRESLDIVEQRLLALRHELKRELNAHSNAWLNALQQNFDEVKGALVDIRTTQGTHNERLDQVASKDDVNRIESKLDGLIKLLTTDK
jgi:chromosome segregation ATPase